MRAMTQKQLEEAFAGESQAHMKYMAFAEKARKDGRPNIARLFQATAFAEQVHAMNHLQALSGINTTSSNLEAAIAGETYEVEEMYATFLETARRQGEKTAERTNRFAMEAEKTHAVLYAAAKENADKSEDTGSETIHVCEVCGYTVIGEAPDVCPVCNMKKDKFRQF